MDWSKKEIPTRESEIRKIHQKAAQKSTEQLSGEEITELLKDIDDLYLSATEAAAEAFDIDGDMEKYNSAMIQATLDLYKATEDAVGEEMTRKVLGQTYSETKSLVKEQTGVTHNQAGISNKDTPSI